MTVTQHNSCTCEDLSSPLIHRSQNTYMKNSVLSFATRVLKASARSNSRRPTESSKMKLFRSHRPIHPQDGISGSRSKYQNSVISINAQKKSPILQSPYSVPSSNEHSLITSREQEEVIVNKVSHNVADPTQTYECEFNLAGKRTSSRTILYEGTRTSAEKSAQTANKNSELYVKSLQNICRKILSNRAQRYHLPYSHR